MELESMHVYSESKSIKKMFLCLCVGVCELLMMGFYPNNFDGLDTNTEMRKTKFKNIFLPGFGWL